MKNNLSFLLLILTLLASCNKVKKVSKHMSGNWTITQYTFQNLNDFKYTYSSEGSLFFEKCNNGNCTYELNLSYKVEATSFQKNESGIYELHNNAEHYTLLRKNPNGSVSNLNECRIVFINKDQMKTEIKDEFGIHHLVLEK